MRRTIVLLSKMRTINIPHCLPNGPTINVSVSKRDEDLSKWLDDNKIMDGSPSVLGFDCEWRPNFRPGSPENNVALIQMATTNSVFLYQIKHSPRGEPLTNLARVMKSTSITKVGVGVLEDLKKLQVQYNIEYGAYWDVAMAARRTIKPPLHKTGLGQLMREFYGVDIPKPKRVQMSNWEMYPLNNDQVKYAAWDALCGSLLYDYLRLNTTAFEATAFADKQGEVVGDSNEVDAAAHNYVVGPAISDLLCRGVHWNEEYRKQLLVETEGAAAENPLAVPDKDTATNKSPEPTYNATRTNFRPALRMAEESHLYVGVLCDFIARESLADVLELGTCVSQSLCIYGQRLNCTYKINNKAKQAAALATESPGSMAGKITINFETMELNANNLINRVGALESLILFCAPVDLPSRSSYVCADAEVTDDKSLEALLNSYPQSAMVSMVLVNGHLMGWTVTKSKMVGINEVCRMVLSDLFGVQQGIIAAAAVREPVFPGVPDERVVDLALLFAGCRRGTDTSASTGTLPPEYADFFATRPVYLGAARVRAAAGSAKKKKTKPINDRGDAAKLWVRTKGLDVPPVARALKEQKPAKLCSYYHSTKGCRLGAQCTFRHERAGGSREGLSSSCKNGEDAPNAQNKVRGRTSSLGSVAGAEAGTNSARRKKKPKTKVVDRVVVDASRAKGAAPRVGSESDKPLQGNVTGTGSNSIDF